MPTAFGRRSIVDSAKNGCSIDTPRLLALSTHLPTAPVAMLSAMTPQAVKTAISTVPIKLTAHAIGSYLH